MRFYRQVVHLVLALALVGCKSTPPVEKPSVKAFEVLDAGAEPRSLLRYSVAKGTTTKSKIVWDANVRQEGPAARTASGLESAELTIAYGPADLVEDGIRCPVEITDAKLLAREGPVVSFFENVERAVKTLEGTGGRITFNDRGQLLGGRYNEQALDVPIRLLLMVENTLTTLDFIQLPEEPVGVGAQWVSRATLLTYGIKMEQETVYELIEHNGNEVLLGLSLRRSGDQQMVEASAPTSVEVISSRVNGVGRARLDLAALASNTEATVTIRSEFSLDENGEREVLNLDETVQITIESETTVPSEP